jgi:hypothetical protein
MRWSLVFSLERVIVKFGSITWGRASLFFMKAEDLGSFDEVSAYVLLFESKAKQRNTINCHFLKTGCETRLNQ